MCEKTITIVGCRCRCQCYHGLEPTWDRSGMGTHARRRCEQAGHGAGGLGCARELRPRRAVREEERRLARRGLPWHGIADEDASVALDDKPGTKMTRSRKLEDENGRFRS